MAYIDVITSLKSQLKMCFKIIEQYNWLLDSYVLDFFTDNHMQKLPNSWRSHLESISLEELHYLINLSVQEQNHVRPLSLISLKAILQYLTLPRNINEHDYNLSIHFLKSNKIDITQILNNSTQSILKGSFCFKYPKLNNLFLKHVKPKKRYEIFKIAQTTAEIAKNLGVSYVVDIGSGLGHLSRIMAYGFNLKVCSIETQTPLTNQAEKLDLELENAAGKYLTEAELLLLRNMKPVHLNQTLKFNLKVNEFINNIQSAFSNRSGDFKFGIVGLHPCGDLATLLLKLYSECSGAKFINLIGCCYHKLSTESDSASNIGFPLTKFCSEISPDISYEARALACHAIETYCNRLKSKNYHHLKIHCYRATLEKLIYKNWPHLRKNALNNVKPGPDLNFTQYCQMALKNLNLTIPNEDLNSEEVLQNLSNWQLVVKYYSLRLMLAPLIETVILLDRKMYLLEQDINCKIVTAFHPEISPRNHLLISEKSI